MLQKSVSILHTKTIRGGTYYRYKGKSMEEKEHKDKQLDMFYKMKKQMCYSAFIWGKQYTYEKCLDDAFNAGWNAASEWLQKKIHEL